MGSYGALWGPMGPSGALLAPMGRDGPPWAPMCGHGPRQERQQRCSVTTEAKRLARDGPAYAQRVLLGQVGENPTSAVSSRSVGAVHSGASWVTKRSKCEEQVFLVIFTGKPFY